MNVVSYQPTPEELSYTFGGRAAVARVTPGTVLEIFTEDCFGGRVRGPGDLPSQVCEFPYLNPVTGPFHVEGAEPGDTLALHFVSIEPARDYGVSTTFPHFGALTATHTTAMLHQPLEERVWVYEVDAAKRTVRYRASRGDFTVELPLDPMHGTVGVAPAASESRMTIVPDAHGGNMDTPELRAGVTLYLGVNVEGGLFSVGDGHARQGHGEVCGTGVEAAMNTVVAVELIKGVGTPWPRLEDDEHLMSTGSARPLEDAYRISQHDLVTWSASLVGLDELDAYQLVSQGAEAPVGNVCDANYTMVAKLPKAYLGGPEVYQAAHRRLRELGERYLAR
ncbi:acetamidase/formamidase family protein [Spongiactinospora sp. TRM90649]|uniref:acetamidase/formamidase family protein n=1 Tax=Spongiactinospora sp. TRM90649 TaxID=3031114 RepID=UPI0023F77ACE|nr:acetamidase/formamidase family protein [Spongiactinospora sp. TRM90649]MDF5754450.1 acetamidase/formamidase family protein [Spongiactinospora sp. TRM90649]